ncbi:uncharacterized protein LOC125017779 [Mugil cephalus]|uniref:uncharacterized protein LOC125017779 n=1 Tax=Mugil cephalus TaxID=48193 RepID=UPI001FB6B5C4|nr:uncharacterized protein LOC125017779 [Mugil cephalus]
MLKQLRRLDPDACHIVRWNGFFFDKDRICLNFELLDQSLHAYIQEQHNLGLPVTELKPVLYQLAIALSHLNSIGIMHADLKPENVMVVNRHQKSLQVKVIDFGLARPLSDAARDHYVQTLWYRAPEVMLAAPFNETIDMWSLGLVAAEMVTGCTLYPGNSTYDVLRFIVHTQGQPADNILHSGSATDHYFEMDEEKNELFWKFKTPEEYEIETGYHPQDTRYIRLNSLDDLKQVMKIRRGHHDDQHLLVALIKSMLNLDANQRIKPMDVLKHPFFASILPQSSYVDSYTDKNPQVSQQQPLEENINSQKDDYIMEEILGQGGFGVVMKCHNKKTNKSVAVKVNKNIPETVRQAKLEIDILKRLRCLDPDTCNIVKWNGFFFDREQICIDFELLDQSLHSYIQEQRRQGLPMTEVKSIIQQLATALSHLNSIGIVHADLKPGNVMVVNRHQKPLKLKVIDFGLAHPVSAATPGVCVQTLWYRAPEVMLAIPYNEAIDMWSLGLVAAELVTGYPLYSGLTDYDVLRFIIHTQGQLADHILHCGQATEYFFQVDDSGQQYWRLKTPAEFENDTGYQAKDTRFIRLNCLDDLEQVMRMKTGHHDDQHLLVSLIKSMLHLDANQRIKPLEVLKHPLFASSKDKNPQISQQSLCWQITEPRNHDTNQPGNRVKLDINAYMEKDIIMQSAPRSQNNDYTEEDLPSKGGSRFFTKWRNPEINQPIKPQEFVQPPVGKSSIPQRSYKKTYTEILDIEYKDPQVSQQSFCWHIGEPGKPDTNQPGHSVKRDINAYMEEDIIMQSAPNSQNNNYAEEDLPSKGRSRFFTKWRNPEINQPIKPQEVVQLPVLECSVLQRSYEKTYTDILDIEYKDPQVSQQSFCWQIGEPGQSDTKQSSHSVICDINTYMENDIIMQSVPNSQNNGHMEEDLPSKGRSRFFTKWRQPESNQGIKPQEVVQPPVIASSVPQSYEDGEVSLQNFLLPNWRPRKH